MQGHPMVRPGCVVVLVHGPGYSLSLGMIMNRIKMTNIEVKRHLIIKTIKVTFFFFPVGLVTT